MELLSGGDTKKINYHVECQALKNAFNFLIADNKGKKLIGLCGNSSEPHLHFHIQNVENMNITRGVKCYFDKIIVNGYARDDYSPVKNDKIKN